MQKLYCYVDETGQDARSEVFIVVAVVSEEEQIHLRQQLINALRIDGISLGLVKMRRDESEPLIRLADRWAGCVRSAIEKNHEAKKLLKQAKKVEYLIEIAH